MRPGRHTKKKHYKFRVVTTLSKLRVKKIKIKIKIKLGKWTNMTQIPGVEQVSCDLWGFVEARGISSFCFVLL